MFDLTSSKLLILAVVALLVVGPKDLPALMRTIGRYVGMIRRQANEFRAQFEDAMRESELADLKKEVEQLGSEARDTLRETGSAVESHVSDVTREVNESLADAAKPEAGTVRPEVIEHAHADAGNGVAGASDTPHPDQTPMPPSATDEPAHREAMPLHDPGAVAAAPEREHAASQTRSGA